MTIGRRTTARRLTTRLGAALLAGLGAGSAAAAGAAQSGLAGDVEPLVDRRSFGTLLDRIGADDDQRLVAEILYSDYAASVEMLAERRRDRMEGAGRQRVDDALAGRAFLDPETLRDLRVGLARAEHETWPEAQRLGEALLRDAVSLLGSTTEPRVAFALAEARAEMYLRPHRARADDESYGGEGVDVALLAAAAAQGGGELEGMAPGALPAMLARYRRELDDHLVATAAAEHEGHLQLALARIQRNRAREAEERRRALQRWQALYAINKKAVDRIAAAAGTAGGPDAEARWRDRFDRACFPHLFRARRPEKQHAWISRRAEATVRAKADGAIAAYRDRKAALDRSAVALLLRARLAHGSVVTSGMDPSRLADARARDIYERLLQLSGRRSRLAADASATLDALVSERERKQMHADIAAEAYGRRWRRGAGARGKRGRIYFPAEGLPD